MGVFLLIFLTVVACCQAPQNIQINCREVYLRSVEGLRKEGLGATWKCNHHHMLMQHGQQWSSEPLNYFQYLRGH